MSFETADNTGITEPDIVHGATATVVMLINAAIERSYTTYGLYCPLQVQLDGQSTATIVDYGFPVAAGILSVHLLFGLFSLICFLPLFLSPRPFSPAVRAMSEASYFMTLLSNSELQIPLASLATAETYSIWQSLDRKVCIGESIQSADQDIGLVMMDIPKLIRPFTNSRRYK